MSAPIVRLTGAVIRNGTIRSIVERKTVKAMLPGARYSSNEAGFNMLFDPYVVTAGLSSLGALACLKDSWFG